MIGNIKKIKDTAHFVVDINNTEQSDEMIRNVIICSDADIEIVKGGENNEIIVNIIDENFSYDLRKEPNIIAVNTNSAIVASKEALNATSMKITISQKE